MHLQRLAGKRLSGRPAALVFMMWAASLQAIADPGLGRDGVRDVVILFTNDLESTYEPVPAYWRDDVEFLGGFAHLARLISDIRRVEPLTFLFDGGDMYTGALSKATSGEVSAELMLTMGYDAKAIGDHEFEYGWEAFARNRHRMPFPNLGANIYYRGTGIRFAPPYTVIERDGFRVGVIGVTGLVAESVIPPGLRDGIEFRDPEPEIAHLVTSLRPAVDLIVLLTHAGKTAPMQTDDEAHPELTRNLDTNMAIAGSVPGIDVLIGGHSDAGTPEPLVHPQTGTIVVQTFGQGTTLGKLKLSIDTGARKVLSVSGELLPVVSADLPPDPDIERKLAYYRARHADLYEVVGWSNHRLVRAYQKESDIGNFLCDVLRESTGAEIAFFGSGGIRRDLPAGKITVADLWNVYPFLGRMVTMRLTGSQIEQILEQSFTGERGVMQVAGIEVEYDPNADAGSRVVSAMVGANPLRPDRTYAVATTEFFATGGDLYEPFLHGSSLDSTWAPFGEVLREHIRSRGRLELPVRGRLVSVP